MSAFLRKGQQAVKGGSVGYWTRWNRAQTIEKFIICTYGSGEGRFGKVANANALLVVVLPHKVHRFAICRHEPVLAVHAVHRRLSCVGTARRNG